MALVFVYPEKTREPLGAERWECSWEQVKASASRRNQMVKMNAKRKHEREGHAGEFGKCEVDGCQHWRYTDIDPDSDIDNYYQTFRGADARDKALEFAKKEVAKGKTAYGVVMVQRQVVDWYVEEDHVAEWRDAGEQEEVSG